MITMSESELLNAIMSLPTEIKEKYVAEYHLDEARPALRAAANDGEGGKEEGGEYALKKYYTFDELGHIMIATNSPDATVSESVQNTFQKVLVFFSAMTSALKRKDRTLFDFDAVNSVIAKSGAFVATQQDECTYSSKSTSVSLNADIIAKVVGDGVTAGGVEIAKRALSAIGKQLSASYSTATETSEVAHVLFVCELLMGIPIVSVSLFHTKTKQRQWEQKTNCEEVSQQEVSFSYDNDHYLFVDPSYIKKFSSEFAESPEYAALIDRLAGYIDEPPAKK